MFEVRVIRKIWYVETGYCDGGGVGYWDGTKESVPCDTLADAEALRDQWLESGKLRKMHWGDLWPNFDMGLFRIEAREEVIKTQALTEPITDASAEIAAIAMWQHEAQCIPASVRNGRTPRAWLEELPQAQDKWRGLARAALEAVTGGE